MSELGRDHRDPSTGASDADSASADPFGRSAIQRKVLERRALQRRKAQAGQAEPGAGEAAPAAGPSGAGTPLPASVREKMERAFGADFSDVRVHEGPKAAAIGAAAYTQGSDIHFAPGQYQPGTAKGDELLGHELAHVVQQRAGKVATPQAKGAPINADAGLESEADALGAKAARGEPSQVTGAAAGTQRKTAGAPIQAKDGDQELPKGSFNVAQAAVSQRGRLLASALKDGSFDRAVKALIDGTVNIDKSFKTSFIEAWKELGGTITNPDDNVQKVCGAVIKSKFADKQQQRYLITVAGYGEPGLFWETKLALGSVFGSYSAAESEVVRLVEKASAGSFPIKQDDESYQSDAIPSWGAFWTRLNSDPRLVTKLGKEKYARLKALNTIHLAEQAEKDHHEEEQDRKKLGKSWNSSVASKVKADQSLDVANQSLKAGGVKVKAQDGAGALRLAEINHFAAVIRDQKKLFNEVSPEAIDLVREWLEEHKDEHLRQEAVDPKGPLVATLKDVIKKERDRKLFLDMIHGGQVATGLKALSMDRKDDHEIEEESDALNFLDALLARERAKTDLGKGKRHRKLKERLREATANQRELYLAYAGGQSPSALKNPRTRTQALSILGAKLQNIGIKEAKDREEILAMFANAEVDSGTHYIELRRMCAEKKIDKAKALHVLTKLTGDEYRQVRQDGELTTKLEQSVGKETVEALLGGSGPIAGEHASARAQDDAELNPAHWAVIIKRELDKPSLLLRQHGGQSLEKVGVYFYQAQAAAERNQELNQVPVKIFMQEIVRGLGDSRIELDTQFPGLITMVETGEHLSAALLRQVLVGTFHNWTEGYARVFEHASGRELLDDYSNFAEFLAAKDTIEKDGKATQEEKVSELFKLHSTFVLDVHHDRKKEIEKICGPAPAAKMVNRLRTRLSEAAESDPRFKVGLEGAKGQETGYVNSEWSRKRMGIHNQLDLDDRAQSGTLKLGAFSAWGRTHEQAQNRVVRDVRKVNSRVEDASGPKDSPHELGEHQDQALEHHKAELDQDLVSDEQARGKFNAVKERAKLIAEITITVLAAVIVAAATHGAGVAPMTALLIKLGASLVAGAGRMVVGKLIQGKDFDTRKAVTSYIATNVAFAAADFGWGVPENLEQIKHLSEYGKSAIEGLIAGPGKTLFRDGMMALFGRGDDDVKADEVLQAALMIAVEEQLVNALGTHLKELNTPSEHGGDSAPEHGGATPEHGGATPELGADSTPEHGGGATPEHGGGSTPEHGGGSTSEHEERPDLWKAKAPWKPGDVAGEAIFNGGVKGGIELGEDRLDKLREKHEEHAEERAEVEEAHTPGAKGRSDSQGWQASGLVVSVRIKDPKSDEGKAAKEKLFRGIEATQHWVVESRGVEFSVVSATSRSTHGLFALSKGSLGAFIAWLDDAVEVNLERKADPSELPTP